MRSTVSSANNKAQDSVEREEMGWITPSTVTTVVAACLVAWLLQIIAFSPISPGPSIFQSDYEPQAHFVKNNVLQTIEKLGEGFLEGPEDSAVDRNGLIYTATQDGWIKRMHPNGSWEDWKKVGGSLLGLAVSRSGHIIVCDPERTIEKLGEGFLEGPEDSAVDGNGLIYTATQDGWIKRMHPNGSWEDWKKVGGSLLGLAVSRSGHIIVCDPERGLLKVSDEEVSIITSEIDGEKIRFVDAVVEGSDGSLYFSDASTKFPYSRCILDFLEGEPYGRLLKYDPQTKKTSVLLDGLGFANGVALPPSEDYVAICETWKFRCLKYWIKGEKSGKTEVLVDNLPGGPDNINIASDGHSYWIAILKLRIKAVQFMFKYSIFRHILARYPTLLNQFGLTTGWAMVAKVGEDGTIIKTFDDSNGKVISFLTSAMEVGEYLYLGNLNTKFLGRLNLNEVRQ